jgi:DNA-binding protein Fis
METKEVKDEESPLTIIENILYKDLENILTFLESRGNGKSMLYEDVLSMIDRNIFKIALERSGKVKTTAAAYLGINRNTFQKKMTKLGMNGTKE